MRLRIALIGWAAVWALGVGAWQASAQPAASVTPTPGGIPEAEFATLDKLMHLDTRLPADQRQKAFPAQLERFIVRGHAIETAYPKADNLYVLRLGMLRAAGMLFSEKKDDASRQSMLDIARTVVENPAPLKAKVYPHRILTAEKIQPKGAAAPAVDAEGTIREFVKQYDKTDAAAQALMDGYRLARQIGNEKLAVEFLALLESAHGQEPVVFRFLADAGRGPVFRADLTTLDGKRLRLPDAMTGKVVVVDFWATWCPPCVDSQPRMRKLYAKYKSQGVEIVGVSLDKPGKADELKDYVKDAGLPWLHTYSGLYQDDPTARMCHIEAIPSVWVIGRDGRIIAASVPEDQLDAVIGRAVAAK
ncbi:MAG: TlpA disulfide reductase family protein [Planctomycetota bacterium]